MSIQDALELATSVKAILGLVAAVAGAVGGIAWWRRRVKARRVVVRDEREQ